MSPDMAQTSELREVEIERGALRFRMPATWAGTKEEDGTDAFYEGEGEAGILRVKLMTFTSPDLLTPPVALAELEVMERQPGQSIEPLGNGNALRAHSEKIEADGEQTTLHVWMLASIEPPHRMRLAVFSFAVLAGDLDDLTARRTVATLHREIRRARFAHQIDA
jgi:hypothetical protein